MGLRDLRNRIRDTRSGDTTDPLGLVPHVTEEVRDVSTSEGPIRRQGADTTGPADPWIDAITPDGEDTDPGGADLASADPNHEPAPGAHRSVQTKYGVGVSRCGVLGCGTHTTGLVCSVCTAAGRLPPDVGGYVPPYLERILPDPPNSRHTPGFLDGAGYVLEPLLPVDDDYADFDEARDRLRAEVLDRIHSDGAA